MGKTQGYNQYVCDRCGQVVYAVNGEPKVQKWSTITRYGAEGIKQERLLCKECTNEYRTLAQQWDKQFLKFITEVGEA